MRLIDADVLLEHIKKLECHAENKKYEQGLNDCLQFYFPQIIDKQPTAYSVEKVVAELENASHWEEPTFDEDGYCNDDSWEVVYLDKATEIVRKGGIDG